MVELTLQLESPYVTTGELSKTGVKRGDTVIYKLKIDGDPTAPDMEAKIQTAVYGPADPMTDFKTPILRLNGEEIDIRNNRFHFPSGGNFDLEVEITILKTAKWFGELRIRADAMPADW